MDRNFAEIRDGVRELCEGFPGEYWRELDRERAYPTEFVAALDRGRLSRGAHPGGVWRRRAGALRRRRDHGGDPASGLQRRRLPCADVHHGHAAAARQRRAEERVPAEDRGRANCGFRRSASPSRRRGTDTTRAPDLRRARDGDHYVVNGQKIWTSRAEHSDLMLLLARTTPRDEVKQQHRRPLGVPRRAARGARQGLRSGRSAP